MVLVMIKKMKVSMSQKMKATLLQGTSSLRKKDVTKKEEGKQEL